MAREEPHQKTCGKVFQIIKLCQNLSLSHSTHIFPGLFQRSLTISLPWAAPVLWDSLAAPLDTLGCSWMLHPWECSRTALGETWDNGRWGGWTRWFLKSLPTQTILGFSDPVEHFRNSCGGWAEPTLFIVLPHQRFETTPLAQPSLNPCSPAPRWAGIPLAFLIFDWENICPS